MEASLSLQDLGLTADSPAPGADPNDPFAAPPMDGEQPSGDGVGLSARSADAKAVDETIKTSLRSNIENHELACLVVDIVSPGQALERMGGAGLEHLTPMQHMIIACTAITGTVLITNPHLAKKLQGSLMKSPKDRLVKKQRKDTMKIEKSQAPTPSRVPDDAPAPMDATGQPVPTMRDLTGEVL